MTIKKIPLLIFLSAIPFPTACNIKFEDLGITIDGIAYMLLAYDTRRYFSENIFDGEYNLWPFPKQIDTDARSNLVKAELNAITGQPTNRDINAGLVPMGKDVNAKGQGCLSYYSRTTFTTKQFDFRNGKLSNQFTIEFFGSTDFFPPVNFNLKTAMFQLDWEKIGYQIGIHAHPLNRYESYPRVHNRSFGQPFHYGGGNPQMRMLFHPSKEWYLEFAITAVRAVNDLINNTGPYNTNAGSFSHLPARFAALPGLSFITGHIFGEKYTVGLATNYMRVVPRLQTSPTNGQDGIKTREQVGSVIAMLFSHLDFDTLDVRSHLSYGEHDQTLAGFSGYVAQSIDPITDKRTWTPLRAVKCYIDFDAKPDKKLRPGLYLAFLKSLGSRKRLDPSMTRNGAPFLERLNTVYTFPGAEFIDTFLRVSPRLRWNIDNVVSLAFELEWNRARFAQGNNDDERAANLETNMRVKKDKKETVNHVRTQFGVWRSF